MGCGTRMHDMHGSKLRNMIESFWAFSLVEYKFGKAMKRSFGRGPYFAIIEQHLFILIWFYVYVKVS